MKLKLYKQYKIMFNLSPGACLDDFCVYALLLGGCGGMLPRKFFLLNNAVGAFWGVFKHKK